MSINNCNEVMTMSGRDENENESSDKICWDMPLSFTRTHVCTEEYKEVQKVAEVWRTRDRMKTVSVAIVLCLNVGVDPPDVVKTQPCARLEAWIDPTTLPPSKALESIGMKIQSQYERWHNKARYKQSLDPTVEEVKKLCTSLRRGAKEDRVLFHYNGHGVPRPTTNGEIWVFNKNYTQYIPLSLYDLQTWVSAPSIFVFDCSNAGIIVDLFKQFAKQHEEEFENIRNSQRSSPHATHILNGPRASFNDCIQLAACTSTQILPMNPNLPADLFTACLTTPIKMAAYWYILQKRGRLASDITLEEVDQIPGKVSDRTSMIGDLNWVYTTITDTIAWNVLPRDLFQKLFRQDLLVASLFRNFLLAERIMRTYNCTPVSSPKLPPMYNHPIWQSWDFALEKCLAQLKGVLNDGAEYQQSSYFQEQVVAFEVWLSLGLETRKAPEQLPIVLQVLLSQAQRVQALDLLGRFLDLGPWAVNDSLSVGIFPYVLKLIQANNVIELRPLLVFIWAKILSIDKTSRLELIKDRAYVYFLDTLADLNLESKTRTLSAYIISCIVNDCEEGQELAFTGNVIALCLEQLNDSDSLLRQWLAVCLGRVWTNYDAARWRGVRDSAHEKLYTLLLDKVPDVRAAAVFALGTFVSSVVERTDHANMIDHSVAMKLINTVGQDGSPIVRKELVVALHWFVLLFENNFLSHAISSVEDEQLIKESSSINVIQDMRSSVHLPLLSDITQVNIKTTNSNTLPKMSSSKTRSIGKSANLNMPVPQSSPSYGQVLSGSLENTLDGVNAFLENDKMRRVSSSSSLVNLSNVGNIGNIYANIWKTLVSLSKDAVPEIERLGQIVVDYVYDKAKLSMQAKEISSINDYNFPSNQAIDLAESPPSVINVNNNEGVTIRTSAPSLTATLRSPHHSFQPYQHSTQFSMTRKIFAKGPDVKSISEVGDESVPQRRKPLIKTSFVEWSAEYFSRPILKSKKHDPEDKTHYLRDWRYQRNTTIRKKFSEEMKLGPIRLDDQVFINKNSGVPTFIKLHPFDNHFVVADKESNISIWDWDQGIRKNYFSNKNPKRSQISSVDLVNSHDDMLLLTGSDDGNVRIWKEYNTAHQSQPYLVTAWQALSDMIPSTRSSGLVLVWEQMTSTLLSSGDVRIIRLWDVNTGMKVQDLPTGAGSCVTSMASDQIHGSLIAAGCGDGSVRIFDRRLPPNDCRVITYRDHQGWVVNVFMQTYKNNQPCIISGSVNGDILFWDPRFSNYISHCSTSQGMTAMSVHPNADIIACGSVNQFIGVYNSRGETLNVIKYHDGFMGQRIGPVSCLDFHEHKIGLIAGSTDSFISLYSSELLRRR
ncbi:Regulatory-associated protein of mTOR [Nymphon striatum]|nr:Regulatory-associated protein of mTOR [Nymphon striatum]